MRLGDYDHQSYTGGGEHTFSSPLQSNYLTGLRLDMQMNFLMGNSVILAWRLHNATDGKIFKKGPLYAGQGFSTPALLTSWAG